jgi:hypothetical protein
MRVSSVTPSPAAEIARELAAFPAVLNSLLADELAAGNSVTEVGCGFPAPPCGAWARLAKAVSSRPRRSAAGVLFRARNWPGHSFEWSDGDGCFFLLEPPLPVPRQAGMDDIRAAEAVGAGVPLPAAAPPPVPAPGAYLVDIDYRGEMVTYREEKRSADVSCCWGPHPIIGCGSLTGWRHTFEPGGSIMSEEERHTVLDRIAEHLRGLNIGEVEIVD